MIIIDFITKHLITKIEDYTKQIKYDEFYYFNEPVKNGSDIIDRINRFSVYRKGQSIPYNFYHVKQKIFFPCYSLLMKKVHPLFKRKRKNLQCARRLLF